MALVLAAMAGGIVVVQVRGGASGPATVCHQLSLPGLTKPEAQQILKSALDRGISAEQLHEGCGDLVDEFNAP